MWPSLTRYVTLGETTELPDPFFPISRIGVTVTIPQHLQELNEVICKKDTYQRC